MSLLVNKLGDASREISAKCIELLKKLVYHHPAMKAVVVREIRQFVYRPGLPPRSLYIGMICLSQIPLMSGDHVVAVQLVECYLSMFEECITADVKDSKGRENGKKVKGKNRKVKGKGKNLSEPENKESGSRLKLLSVLLSGVNKTFPFLKDHSSLYKHIDALFRLVHDENFSTSTQALVLISHMALQSEPKVPKGKSEAQLRRDKQREAKAKREASSSSSLDGTDDKSADAIQKDLSTRFYRALYSQLLSDQLMTKSKNVMFLNLLYRSMKNDPSNNRTAAFAKRLLICSTHCGPHIAAGL